MGVGKALADRKGNEFLEPKKESKSSKNLNSPSTADSHKTAKRNRRRKKKITDTPVQTLFEACKEVFANGGTGVIPSPEKIERLRDVLDGINPEDVGLDPKMPYFRLLVNRRTPAITYLHLHECDNFSIGIFCLPPSGVIPLHNHPGMTVFSKLLFGTMHIKSYDWALDSNNATSAVNPSRINGAAQTEARLAKLKVDSDFTAPCNTSILYPADGGNMHCFTAVTACAVLDVLGPPYSDPDGRHCTYYFDYPLSKYTADGLSVSEEDKEQYAWLEERDFPEELAVVGAPYIGPQILEN